MKHARFIVPVLIMLLLLGVCTGASAATIVDSGTCGLDGDDVKWTLYSNGGLTIYGEGEMRGWDVTWGEWSIYPPWYEYRDRITSLQVCEGVTNIGSGAFAYLYQLTDVSLPNGLKSIGWYSFAYCPITSIVLPDSVETIYEQAFCSCSALRTVYIGKNERDKYGYGYYQYGADLKTVSKNAFQGCNSLTDVYYAGSEEWSGGIIGVNDTNPKLANAKWHYQCGDNVYYTHTGNVLEITGHGDMYENTGDSNTLWFRAMKNEVTTVRIGSGVTSIGNCSFYSFSKLTDVTIPDSVREIGAGAFENCASLKSIRLPRTVQDIGVLAFAKCTALETIELPPYIQTIEQGTFEKCSSLTTIYIPSSVTTINRYAFMECPSIADVYYGGTMEGKTNIYIEFANTSEALTDALWHYKCGDDIYCTLEDGVLDIVGSGDMYDWSGPSLQPAWYSLRTSVKTVNIGNGITNIGAGAFEDCTKLETVNIPASVTGIGAGAFENCSALGTVRYYGSSSQRSAIVIDTAGGGNSDLTGAKWYLKCGDDAFWNQTNDVLEIIGTGAVRDIMTYESIPWGTDIRCVIVNEGITRIGAYNFKYCHELTNMYLPDTLIEIGSMAFFRCSDLAVIRLGKNTVQIDNNAFASCTLFDNGEADVWYCGKESERNSRISIGAGNLPVLNANWHYEADAGVCGPAAYWTLDNGGALTITGTGDMYDRQDADTGNAAPWYAKREKIKSVSIASGITGIGNRSFYGCDSLTSAVIPDTVTRIGISAFSSCYALSDVSIPDGVTYIGSNAFNSCALTELYIPDSVTYIGNYAFAHCSDVSYVLLGDGISEIHTGAFRDCTALTDVWYAGTETDRAAIVIDTTSGRNACLTDAVWHYEVNFGICGENAFWTMIGNELRIIGSGATFDWGTNNAPWYKYRASLNTVTIDGSITRIGSFAFRSCAGITELVIPEGVTVIGSYAFSGCTGLEEIWLPESLETVERGAFSSTGNLQDVWYSGREQDKNGIDISTEYNSCLNDAQWHFRGEFGSCGDNITYELRDGVLIITGTGDMYDWSSTSGAPWRLYASKIKAVNISDGVTSVGSYAFDHCNNEKFTVISLPESVTDIGEEAFASNDGYYSRLVEVYMPGVERIGKNAFKDSSKLERISFSTDLTNVDKGAFENCPKLRDVYYAGSDNDRQDITIGSLNDQLINAQWHYNALTGSCGDEMYFMLSDGTLIITGTGEMYDYSTSDRAPWYGRRAEIEKIELGSGMTTIGSYAFYGCTGLTIMDIPDSVRDIEDNAFALCSSLKRIVLPAGLESIGASAFASCVSLGNGSVYYAGTAEDRAGISIISIGNQCLTDPAWNYGLFGYCGDDLFWALNVNNGMLSISGTGDMWDQKRRSDLPWYEYREEIHGLSIGKGVTGIGPYAFSDLADVTSVTIPDGVTKIGRRAFYGLEGLTSIAIPESVTEIGQEAFRYCSALVKVTLGTSVAEIDDTAFGDCRALSDVYYGGSEADRADIEISDGNGWLIRAKWHYGDEFGMCGDAVEWVLTDGVLYISGTGAMYDYSQSDPAPWHARSAEITCISISGTVDRIGDCAFSGCTGLDEIVLPYGIRSIGAYAFDSCVSATRISMPTSVQTVDICAFRDCYALADVWYLGTAGDRANMTIYYNDNGYLIDAEWHYGSLGGGQLGDITWEVIYGALGNTLSISGTGNMPVWSTSSDAPWRGYASDITSVTVGEGITNIGTYAFHKFPRLYSVTLPDSLKKIRSYAFSNCEKLTEIRLPDGLTTIGYGAFAGSGLTGITLPAGVTTVDNDAFKNCGDLEYADMPGVTLINGSAFAGCASLRSITLGADLKTVYTRAFEDCGMLGDVYYEGKQEDRTYIYIQSSNTCLTEAEWHCGTLAAGECGNGVYWELTADGTLGITGSGSINAYDMYNNRAPWYRYSDRITSVTVGENVTNIGAFAFYGCVNMKEAVLPGVTVIGDRAFKGCTQLETLSFGAGLARVGDYAFEGCDWLSYVWYAGTPDNRNGIVFGNGNDYIRIYMIWYSEALNGACGENVYWTLRNGILRVTGTGPMYDWDPDAGVYAPWYSQKDDIRTVEIAEGVTYIGRGAFADLAYAATITVPSSVRKIGPGAFAGCAATEELMLPHVNEIGISAFEDCTGLKEITFGENLATVAGKAFDGCAALEDVYYFSAPDDAEAISFGEHNEDITGAQWHCLGGDDTLTLPQGLRVIELEAFSGTNAAFIVIPETCESIGWWAFDDCPNLRYIINYSDAAVDTPYGVSVINY